MSLRQEIEKFMTKFITQVPEDIKKVMQEESDRLAQSGIAAKALQAGDKAPVFSLPNVEGAMVSSAERLSKGPLVVSFYRGGW
jgi:hypothetical protein